MKKRRNILIWNGIISIILFGCYLTICSYTQWKIPSLTIFGFLFIIEWILYASVFLLFLSKRKPRKGKYDYYFLAINCLTLFLFSRDLFDSNLLNNSYTLIVEHLKMLPNHFYFIENIAFINVLHFCLIGLFFLEMPYKKKNGKIYEKVVS